ncbi:MAG: hypothetical protein JXR22_08145 [Prolixibacteraceae bacterium]|nr:hypothetical protein [Prolixibacteraceae bacterium]
MKEEFDIKIWNQNKNKLKQKYPQLTEADLIWRHETKDDLFRMIANKLNLKKKDFEEIIGSL